MDHLIKFLRLYHLSNSGAKFKAVRIKGSQPSGAGKPRTRGAAEQHARAGRLAERRKAAPRGPGPLVILNL
jgi:hypothetical protein